MKLNIGTKVNVLIIGALILVGGVSLLLSVSALKKEGAFAINAYQEGVMGEKKAQIKDLVNSAFTIAKERLDASQDKEKIRKEYGDQVKAVVNQAVFVFEAVNGDTGFGDMEAGKQATIKIIEKMRWGKDGTGYFWIQDTKGDMVLHPINPGLNGKPLWEIKDPDGKFLFKEMDDILKKDGGGFVDYKWPKPVSEEPVDKISYVKLFEPWGWIIGAGEAGKGFAVVANEIKDLASQTAKASNAIKERVSGIQTSTDGTVAEISNITRVVTQINEIVSTIASAVEEQSATTKEIAENVSQASLGIGEVNENIAQGSMASQGVTKEIAQVTQSSGQMADSSSQVKERANDLSRLAKTLSEMMGKFKV